MVQAVERRKVKTADPELMLLPLGVIALRESRRSDTSDMERRTGRASGDPVLPNTGVAEIA